MAEPTLTLESAQQSLRSLFDLQPDLTSLESVEKLLKELQPVKNKWLLANHPDKVGHENTEKFQQLRAEMGMLDAFLKKHFQKLKSDRTLASLKQKVREEKQQKEEEWKRKQAEEESARLMEERAEKKRRRQELLELVVGGVSFAMCVHSEYTEDLAKTCSFDRWLYMTKRGKLDKSNANLGLANERASSLESQLEQQTLEAKQTAEKLGNLETEIISIVKGLTKKSEPNFIQQLFQSGKCGSNQSINNVRHAFRMMHEDQAETRADLAKQCRDLQSKLQDMEREREQWESRNTDLYGRNQELEASKLALQGERDLLQTACETAKKTLHELREDFDRWNLKASQDFQSQKTSMDNKLYLQQEEIARQVSQLLERDKEIQDLEQVAGERARTLKKAAQREEKLRHQHDELKKELAERNKEIQVFQESTLALQKERDDLQTANETQKQTVEESNRCCEALTQENRDLRSRTQFMDADFHRQQEEIARHKQRDQEIQDLEERIKEVEEVKEALEKELVEAEQRETTLRCECDELKNKLAELKKAWQNLPGKTQIQGPVSPVHATKTSNDSYDSNGSADPMENTAVERGATKFDDASRPLPVDPTMASLYEEVRCAVVDWLQKRIELDEGLQLMDLMQKLQKGVTKWWSETGQGQARHKVLESCDDSKLGSGLPISKMQPCLQHGRLGTTNIAPPRGDHVTLPERKEREREEKRGGGREAD